ncbi:MAG: hypothetical protein HOP20_08045 [Sulfuriferula sp.]|nr:hypothetical protein [Sulfuriferula sp.]
MKNTVNVHAEFDYQGVSHTPKMTLDLDVNVKTLEDAAAIAVLLAKANHIDSYSYQYEILLDSRLVYSDATGLAVGFLHDGEFDFAGFLAASSENHIVTKLQKIAQAVLGVSDLSAQPLLKQALLQAYHLER